MPARRISKVWKMGWMGLISMGAFLCFSLSFCVLRIHGSVSGQIVLLWLHYTGGGVRDNSPWYACTRADGSDFNIR